MRYYRFLGIMGLAISLMLTGCEQRSTLPDTVYPLPERLENLSVLVPDGERRARPFAADLCVVSPDVPHTDSQIGAEAAALFSLDEPSALFAKNCFERLYPASTTKIMTALVAIRYGNLSDKEKLQER